VTTSLLAETAYVAHAGATEAAISIRGLTKRFPRRRSWKQTLRHPIRGDYATVLHRIDCEIRRGEFFGLLGPNGAGKTTLFKILATLILPDEGSVSVEGCDAVDDGAGVRRALAPVIADERSLHWRLSAYENLRLFAVLQGVRPDVLKPRVAELLGVVGLENEGSKLVGAFSSGMKQRLLIARALIAAPKVLLLDEPTRSLDPVTARDFRAFLRKEIAGSQGCTVVLATHNTEEALQLCDRVAILNRGRMLATGAPAILKEQFGDERYRLWTGDTGWTTWAALAERGVTCHRPVSEPGPDGWSVVEVDVPGGPARVAEILQFLVGRGVAVARCERIELSLADLIERVLQRA
jgi:ABC-2 type transport system ATP-binding protein